MILQAGALVELSGTKLQLTRAGRKALGDPPAVTRNAWMLYIDEAQYGSLGYDGLMSIRITAFGASALGIATDIEIPAPVATAVLQVLPDLQVVAVGVEVERSVRMALDASSVPVSDVVWRIDRAKLLAAGDQGWSIEQIRTFLATHNAGALPDAASRLLQDVAERSGQVVDRGLVRLVECRDPALAALLANDRRTARQCTAAGDRYLVVPTSSEAAFRRALRDLGYRLASSDE